MTKRAKSDAKPELPDLRAARKKQRKARVQALIKRMHQRTDSVLRHRRKAALAVSAGAMGITSAALGIPSSAPASATEFTVPMPELRKPAALLICSQAL